MKRTFCAIVSVLLLLNCIDSQAQLSKRKPDIQYVETYLQYIPYVIDLGAGFIGVESDTQWYDRAIKMGVAIGSQVLITQSFKLITKEVRPDDTDARSFPSGHTALSFCGAELVRQDYGTLWGVGAYAVATSVGVLRVVHNRHYWWDVLAGAGIGVLSAQIGRWTLEPIENLFGINVKKDLQLALTPVADPVSGACCVSLRLNF